MADSRSNFSERIKVVVLDRQYWRVVLNCDGYSMNPAESVSAELRMPWCSSAMSLLWISVILKENFLESAARPKDSFS